MVVAIEPKDKEKILESKILEIQVAWNTSVKDGITWSRTIRQFANLVEGPRGLKLGTTGVVIDQATEKFFVADA